MFLRSVLSLATVAARVYAADPSPGCGQPLPDGQEPSNSYNRTLSDGRRYLLFIPPEYDIDGPAGTIISYHGGSRIPERQLGLDLLTDPQYNTARMVAYPAGTPRPGCEETDECDALYWQVDPEIKVDDIAFTAEVLSDLEENYCVDLDQIYVTGKSQGGGMAGDLACDSEMSTRFAAFAPVSGAFYIDTDETCDDVEEDIPIPCNPGRNDVPILEFHGLADDTIEYDGGPRGGDCLPAISYWVEQWAARNGLSTDGTTTQLADDTPTTKIIVYGSGEQEGLVQHIYAESVAHEWPSTTINDDNEDGQVAEFDATPIILDFFDQYTL